MTPDASYRHCREVARRHGTSFFLAGRLLAPDRRRHVHALYAFARTADDLVDEPAAGTEPAVELDRLHGRLRSAVAGERVDDPVVVGAADTVRRFGIPLDCFDRFFASMRRDLDTSSYDTWPDLLEYMDGSAAVIGEMLLPLLDPTDHEAALDPARSLGLAFQLTNFLRDIGDDLDRGRQYVPREDLDRFGVDLLERRADERFRRLLRFEIGRCRELYRRAGPGIALLRGRNRLAVAAARDLYGAILDEIVHVDVFTTRAVVPSAKRVRIATRALGRMLR